MICDCIAAKELKKLAMFTIVECTKCLEFEIESETELNKSLQKELQEIYEATTTEGLSS